MTWKLIADDRLAIHELMSRHCWALDTGDAEGFVSCFASNGRGTMHCAISPASCATSQLHVTNLVQAGLAGQYGKREAHALPPPLAGLLFPD